ncbi:MAG: OmpA family protein [Bacteroidota bacterium]
MNRSLLLLLCMGLTLISWNQQNLEGNWKGFIQRANQTIAQSDVFYLKLDKNDGKWEGRTRIELLEDEVMAIKSFEGKALETKGIAIQEDYVRNSSNDRNAPTCKLNYTLNFNDSTGYLKGEFESSDCRNTLGKVVLFRTDDAFNTNKKREGMHRWKKQFVRDYQKGYPAPEILRQEQEDFEFEPIYFDHDRSEIREEHYEFLDRLARILGGIHDLRVKVIGHTDAVGTDEYNIGLSERRAQAIKDYFEKKGVDPEKLEIDFKGEREPIETNKTATGKQKNRRVDFEFI